MNFPYDFQSSAMGNIEIEDIGNCTIEAFNDDAESFYLIVKTTLGSVSIFTYGPLKPDFELLPLSVQCTYRRIVFSEKMILKEIRSFLQNPKYRITQAFEIPYDEALSKCRSIIDYMKNLPV